MNLQNQIDWMKTQTEYDLLDGISVPDPFILDRVKSAIVLRCGLLTPIYSQPEVMREAITQWSEAMQWNFLHLAKMVQAVYDPISNYDRTETRSGNFSENSNNSGLESHSGNDNRSITEQRAHTGSDKETTENTVAAENVSSYQSDNKTVRDTEYNSGENTTTTDNLTRGEKIETTGTRKRSGTDSYTLRAYGNIGVTTNFQMLQGEKELISQFNPYKWIAEQFENELCVMVY